MKKKYLVYAECDPVGIGFGNFEVNNPVWVYWKQGLENDKESQQKMPYANSDYCHLMLNNLDLPFDENKYKHITELCNVHKLTYKLYKDVTEDKNNFYSRIVRKEEYAKSSNQW